MASRKAISECHGQDSPYFVGWQEYEKNPYHPIANPSGIIQMGLAENQVCTFFHQTYTQTPNSYIFFPIIIMIFVRVHKYNARFSST